MTVGVVVIDLKIVGGHPARTSLSHERERHMLRDVVLEQLISARPAAHHVVIGDRRRAVGVAVAHCNFKGLNRIKVVETILSCLGITMCICEPNSLDPNVVAAEA